MKTRIKLLPYRFKIVGWILTIPAFATGLWFMIAEPDFEAMTFMVPAIIGETDGSFIGETGYFIMNRNNLMDELIGTVLMAGLLLLCFTRERQEDEYIARVRYESMQWAVLVQMLVFIIAMLSIYGLPFWNFMLVNLFLLPLVFVIRYYFLIFKMNRTS